MADPKKSKGKKKKSTAASASGTPTGDDIRPLVVDGSGGGQQSGGLIDDPGSSSWTTASPTPSSTSKPASTPTVYDEIEEAGFDVEAVFNAGIREGGRRVKEAVERDIEDVKKSFQHHTEGKCLCGKTHPAHVQDMTKKCWCGKRGVHLIGTPR
jgi:hypothetical protein